MDTHHISFVRAVADRGTISAAARELGLTQPALTKIISRVEDRVGAPLFERRSHGVELTPFGALFLKRMGKVEQEMLSLAKEVQALSSGLSGTLTIGVGQFWLGRIIPRVISRLRQLAPDLQIRIVTGTRDQLITSLQRGGIDLMLGRFADDLPDDLEGRALADVRLFLTVGAHHPLAPHEHSIEPRELEPFDWILPPPRDPTATQMIEVFRRVYGKSMPMAVEANSRSLVVGMLQTSDLIAVLPGIAADRLANGLSRLRTDWLDWTCSAGVISVRNRALLPSGIRFLELLRDQMETDASA